MDIELLRESYDEVLKYGFQLKDEYLERVFSNPNVDDNNGIISSSSTIKETFTTLKRKLLEMDLRQHLKAYFPLDINSSTDGLELKGPVVLQIISVGNISQPLRSRDENAQPRLLSIVVSDGTTKVTGLEIEPLSDINASTPPGGKVLFLGGIVRYGKLLFTPNNFQYIGGVVNHLFETYQANKRAQKMRSVGIIEGPPQFEISLGLGLRPAEKTDNQQKNDSKKTSDKSTKSKGAVLSDKIIPPPPPIPHEMRNNKEKSPIQERNDKVYIGNNRRGRDSFGNSRGGRDDSRLKGRSNSRGGGRSGRRDFRDGNDKVVREQNCDSLSQTEKVSFLDNDFPALSITHTKGWACTQCTFINHEALQSCEMCSSKK